MSQILREHKEKDTINNANAIRDKTLGPGISIYDLPRRLVLYIMGFLTPKDVLNVARCSKPLKVLCYDNVLWQHLAEKRWRLSYNTKPENWRIFYRNLHIKRREEKQKQALALKQMQQQGINPSTVVKTTSGNSSIQQPGNVNNNGMNQMQRQSSSNNNGGQIQNGAVKPPTQQQPQQQRSDSSSDLLEVGCIVAIHYMVIKKIGQGSFGEIYVAQNTSTMEKFAIKAEAGSASHPQLHYESKVYKILAGLEGIPSVRYVEVEQSKVIMVMDLLGMSLEECFEKCGRKFSMNTVFMLAPRMIKLIEKVHSRMIIHRDLKPDNFMIGRDKYRSKLYLIDFGLAKRFKDPRTEQHTPYKTFKNMTGTPRYASLNTHLGIEQSRRDDLESLGYIFLYFTRGSLPWQGLPAKTKKQKYDLITEKKQAIPLEKLCEGLPPPFLQFLTNVRQLGFTEDPDYPTLLSYWTDYADSQGMKLESYDWESSSFTLPDFDKMIAETPKSSAMATNQTNIGSDRAATPDRFAKPGYPPSSALQQSNPNNNNVNNPKQISSSNVVSSTKPHQSTNTPLSASKILGHPDLQLMGSPPNYNYNNSNNNNQTTTTTTSNSQNVTPSRADKEKVSHALHTRRESDGKNHQSSFNQSNMSTPTDSALTNSPKHRSALVDSDNTLRTTSVLKGGTMGTLSTTPSMLASTLQSKLVLSEYETLNSNNNNNNTTTRSSSVERKEIRELKDSNNVNPASRGSMNSSTSNVSGTPVVPDPNASRQSPLRSRLFSSLLRSSDKKEKKEKEEKKDEKERERKEEKDRDRSDRKEEKEKKERKEKSSKKEKK